MEQVGNQPLGPHYSGMFMALTSQPSGVFPLCIQCSLLLKGQAPTVCESLCMHHRCHPCRAAGGDGFLHAPVHGDPVFPGKTGPALDAG